MQTRSKSPYGNTEGIATLTRDRIAVQNIQRQNNKSKVTDENKKKGNR
ncbi:MAG: hypothetical protein II841_03030 [Bacteroidales bacterium]|nr:hypothetical protein [Bacteroidales bacterium]